MPRIEEGHQINTTKNGIERGLIAIARAQRHFEARREREQPWPRPSLYQGDSPPPDWARLADLEDLADRIDAADRARGEYP